MMASSNIANVNLSQNQQKTKERKDFEEGENQTEFVVLLRHHNEEESDWLNGESETELGEQLKLNKKGKHTCRVGVIG